MGTVPKPMTSIFPVELENLVVIFFFQFISYFKIFIQL